MSAVLEAHEPSAWYLETIEPPLVRQFDLLAGAPGSVTRLRELILTLAVQGKLVGQDPGEIPATELLAKIRAEKTQLLGEGTIQRTRATSEVADEETPFILPVGWEWVRLPDITYDLGQVVPADDFTYIDVGSIDNHRATVSDTVEVVRAADAPSRARKRVTVGTVLYSTVRPYLKNIAIVERDYSPSAIASTAFAILHPHSGVVGRYLLYYLRSPIFTEFVAAKMAGIAYPAINDANFFQGVVPLPPSAEQARIVARVDELMRLCDALEANGRLEAEQHARLLGTLLGTLTDSTTPEELAANWQRVADHFDLLLDRPEAVDALEQTILQLAVRGLLVPQDQSDEPASGLVRRIRSYRAEQVKAGLAKRERPFIPLSEADLPFELPTGWEWIRFDELIEPAKPISYGVLVPGPEVSGGVPFVRIADLSLTDPPAKPEKSISMEIDAQYQRTRLEGGEILMGVVGSIGKLGVAPPSWAGANIARAICRIVPVRLVGRDFVLLLLQSEFMRASFAGDTRTLAQPTLNVGLIRSSATPLPPIAEQARIVARVKELRRLCADLHQRLSASQTTQSHLAEAVVDMAVA